MTKYLKDGETKVKLRARRKPRVTKKMFKLSDAEGQLTMTEVPFAKTSLDTNDTFLIDNGKMIYIWCGKKSSKQEKRLGIPFAQKYKEGLVIVTVKGAGHMVPQDQRATAYKMYSSFIKGVLPSEN